ncbi:hypothetical protein BDA96_09G243700 [Sorghum bicolor]|uniref:Uncharacterized protein n=1 Tax=Sorghum bicolor TaxID=4558 RepID=A0A921QC26_SORBI|nr:hypothetical protein BDA96_09G243700 [Sorghum bicolor]
MSGETCCASPNCFASRSLRTRSRLHTGRPATRSRVTETADGGTRTRRCPLVTLPSRWAGGQGLPSSRHLRCTVLRKSGSGTVLARNGGSVSPASPKTCCYRQRQGAERGTAGGNRGARTTSFRRRRQGSKAVAVDRGGHCFRHRPADKKKNVVALP